MITPDQLTRRIRSLESEAEDLRTMKELIEELLPEEATPEECRQLLLKINKLLNLLNFYGSELIESFTQAEAEEESGTEDDTSVNVIEVEGTETGDLIVKAFAAHGHNGPVTLTDITDVFPEAKDRIRGMVESWIKKGKIKVRNRPPFNAVKPRLLELNIKTQ